MSGVESRSKNDVTARLMTTIILGLALCKHNQTKKKGETSTVEEFYLF